jgi:CMP-N-acetylneuraminic acid synthetase
MDRAIKVKVHIPATGLAILKEKMQDSLIATFLVKTSIRVFMVRKEGGEIAPLQERGMYHWPRQKLHSHATNSVYIFNSSDGMPELLADYTIKQQKQGLLFIQR